MPKALITGITGQDGSYLAKFLLEKGYEVHGIKRRSSSFNTARIDDIFENKNFYVHHGDMTDSSSLMSVMQSVKPDEIYNLAAQSHVAVSFEQPEYTANSDALGVLRMLEGIRILGLHEKTKFYQASTSELYGMVKQIPQSEETPFYPRSPYGVAKLYAYWITVNYREAYNLFACNGILFNHESPVRGETFVTRKITRGLARIALGIQPYITMGNLDAKRDWGHAKDFVEAQWLMLQAPKPIDYVIATGQQYSVREFIHAVAERLGLSIDWRGTGTEEVGILIKTDNVLCSHLLDTVIIRIDKRYFRPTEVDALLGDSTKARRELGWSPKISFKELVDEMTAKDLDIAYSSLAKK